MTNNKTNSPYTAAITGGGFLFNEMEILLPLLQSPDSEALLKDEGINNRLLQINAETSRKRSISEIKRRYNSMPSSFWTDYQQMEEQDRKAAMFFVILKTYKILFDFHVNVTLRKWRSISKSVTLDDVMMEFNEIAANDEFVDSWSELTKKKVAGAYLSILRRVDMLDREDKLHPIKSTNYSYYLAIGEPWFLEACLLQPYEIEKIKNQL